MYQVNYPQFTPENYHYYQRCQTAPPAGIFGDAVDQGPNSQMQITLEDDDLWRSFSAAGTEMIITKMGRRMFPGLRISAAGLRPAEKYCLVLDIAPVDTKRYKFTDGEWKVGGRAEPQHHRRFFIHPDSPNTGAHWTSNQISFRTAKLTNNLVNDPNMIVLNSMHKYQPRILIVKCEDLDKINYAPSYASYVFPSTQFIAVTAYQNSQVTKLKIAHNPFAKGFRERQSNTRKRTLEAVAHFEQQQHHHQQQKQPERKRQMIDASPSPPPPPQVDLNLIYTESPSSGSTSTNSSFSSGSNDQPNYQLQTDFYQLPIQPIMYDPAEVFVYETHNHHHQQPASTEYYEPPSEPIDSLQYQYPVFPIYE